MIRSIVMFAVFIFCSTAGEIIITHAMKITGEPTRFRPREIFAFLGRALRNPLFWTGVPLLAAKYFLGEKISPGRWAGVALVCAGVALVAIG